MDAIVGYHTNPLTCGVAKFNAELARRLHVPVVPLLGTALRLCRHPLLSLKLVEFTTPDADVLHSHLDHAPWKASYSCFLHSWNNTALERELVSRAAHVYAGSAALAHAMDSLCMPETLWCPPLLSRYHAEPQGGLRVLTFGMAHKLRLDLHRRLKPALDALKRPYTVRLSTALHEGIAFEDVSAIQELTAVYGQQLRWLGVLSDHAIWEELTHCTYCALFFTPAARANNSTLQSAMAAGAVVITNLDEDSPDAWVHQNNLLDVTRLTTLSSDLLHLSCLGARAAATATETFGWTSLVRSIHAA